MAFSFEFLPPIRSRIRFTADSFLFLTWASLISLHIAVEVEQKNFNIFPGELTWSENYVSIQPLRHEQDATQGQMYAEYYC